MSDITKIKIDNERERSYKDFPANREFKKRAEDDNPGGGWPSDLPKPSVGGYGYTEQVELEEIFTKDFASELIQGIYGVEFKNETGATISIGNSYLVNFDGEEFHCIGALVGEFHGVVGNASLMPTGGYDTGEPFLVVFVEDLGMIVTAEGGNHTITISEVSETIHKIDEKYLPEGGFGWTEQGEQTVIVDNEIITTFEQGGMIHGWFPEHFFVVDGAYTVIFNGTEYNLNSTFDKEVGSYIIGEANKYGPDFSRYPFLIEDCYDRIRLYTEFAGDYEVTVIKGSDTIHRIEGKYLPEGGFGWTESGEPTTITWDGDTEGKVSVQDFFYKISDSTPSQTDLVGAIMTSKTSPNGYIPDTQRTIYQTDIVPLDGGFVVEGRGLPLICVLTGGLQYNGATFTETGLYFTRFEDVEFVPDVTLVTYISSLAYSTPDTIHKIDEKYLPDKEIVVNVTYDSENNEWVSDKTYQELNAYAKAGVNIKCLLNVGGTMTVCNLMSYINKEVR